MIPKPLDQITKDDIDALVTDGVAEDRTIEYKEALPGTSDADRKEFFADVVSLTVAGGDLIFGVEEERDVSGKPTGVPKAVHGVVTTNVGAEVLGLETAISTGVAPRIIGLQTRSIDGFTRGPVVVIRVPQSLNAPHMVTYKGSSRFYGRNSAGKYPLDITEIRAAFLAAEALPQRMRDFRAERLNYILGNDTSAHLQQTAAVVLHLLPFSAFSQQVRYDLTGLNQGNNLRLIRPLAPDVGFFEDRVNLEGFLSLYRVEGTSESPSYLQVFRTGAVEATSTNLLRWSAEKQIYGPQFEENLIEGLGRYLQLVRGLGVEPPLAVMLSLLRVRDCRMIDPSRVGPTLRPLQPIDRDTILVPETIIMEYGSDPATLLYESFNAVWNAVGRPQSPYYNAQGQRIRVQQ